MKQKLYPLLIALAALAISASAAAQTSYKLWVAGTQVTSANAKDITAAIGNPAIATGTITYNAATQTLTLNNAKVTTSRNRGIECEIPTTIRLEGTSTVTVTGVYSGITFTRPGIITGPGSLDVTSSDQIAVFPRGTSLIIRACNLTASGLWGIGGNSGYASETLAIENASVKAFGREASLDGVNSLTLTGCAINSPASAAFDASKKA